MHTSQWRRNSLIKISLLSVLGVSVCQANGAQSCTSEAPAAECAEESCGESAGCFPSEYKLLEVHDLFSTVAGDDPLLKCLRDRKCGDLTYSVGGDLRYRHMNERNRLRPGGPGQSSYELWRFTPFVQANYNDFIGGYVQAIDASMFGLDAPYSPSPIDVNRTDLLQYYAELNFGEVGDGKLKYRYGRQFLQYGGQRLLSSLAWANTYRNFEGHKLMYTSDDWDIDAFAMQSLNAAAGNSLHSYSFDNPDQSRWISGVYTTYKGIENNALDLYYLYFDETQSSTTLMDGTRHTIGTRLAGKKPVKNGKELIGTWNWDLEGAYQFGEDNFGSPVYRDVQAGMVGALGGYTFENAPWTPGVGGIFYWGSGDNDPTTGDVNTFTSLYPLGHAYWGQIDNFSGQNLLDYGVQGSVKPHEKLSVITQWHYFDLAQSSDRIYNIAGAALTGSGDKNVGNELDIVGRWTASKTFNVELGYLWFFYGDAVNNSALSRPDAEQLYIQATYLF
jgi:hypothetical protein